MIGGIAALMILVLLMASCAEKRPPKIFPPLPSIDSPREDCDTSERGCEGRSTHEA